jgi:predicted adenylyl cyclase CyaB
LKEILAELLPIMGVVRKRRRVYRVGQTRIHLDQVEGLGDFLEFEVVLRPGQPESEGIAIAQALMGKLDVKPDELINTSYIDIILN